MSTVTGNPVRDQMIATAINEAREAGKPVNVPTLGLEHLPSDFDLTEEELNGVLAVMDAPAASDAEPDAPTEAEPAPTLSAEEARDRVVRLNDELAQARGAVLAAQSHQRAARGRLAASITEFQSGMAKLTPVELLRQHVAEQQQLRALGKTSRVRQSQPGRSVVDQSAYYSRGGTANRGYGPKWRRGAYAANDYGGTNSDPRRGAVKR